MSRGKETWLLRLWTIGEGGRPVGDNHEAIAADLVLTLDDHEQFVGRRVVAPLKPVVRIGKPE